MADAGKRAVSLPGDIRPHSCRCCQDIVVRCGKITDCGQMIVQYLRNVCEMSNRECFLFRGQLQVLLSNLSGWTALHGMCRKICEASVAGRLQLFYPLSPFWKLKKLDRWRLEVGGSVAGSSGSLDFQWKDQSGGEVRPMQELTLFAMKDSELSEKIAASPLQPMISLSAFAVAGPKRLMYVGSSNEPTACIINLKTESMKHYAALSYCWGDASQNKFRTTQKTLASRLQGFNIVELPKTLRDAIKVTRKLGLKYLWIDVLCIVQDDPEDMNVEISHMWRIYRNATITISASRASHSGEGFLHRRDLETTDRNTFAIRWCDLGNSDEPRELLVFCSEAEIRRYKPDPIDTRAWTMQEHKLASRLLRFGKSQMVWRCSHGTHVDGGSEDEEPPETDVGEEKHRAIYSWQQDITQFTTRQVTVMDDRLPAVAAMAADYAPKIGAKPSDYLAGLWRQGLPFMLLWRIESKTASRTYPDLPSGKPLLPTWSWHMARSGVCWPGIEPTLHSDPMLLKVLSHEVTLEDDKVKYGRVKAASLKVFGVLLKVIWSKKRRRWITYDHAKATSQVYITWDFDIEQFEQKLYCLEVRSLGPVQFEGLVVVQGGDDTFRRVGYYERKCEEVGSAVGLNRPTPRQLTLV